MSRSLRAGLVKKTLKKSNIWTKFGRMDRIGFSREGRASRQQGWWMQSVQRKGACGVQVGGKGRRVLGTFQLPMWRPQLVRVHSAGPPRASGCSA